jgi:ferredoxin
MPRSRFQTEHLDVNTRKCTACGACVTACARGVLGIRGFNDKHVHVVQAGECSGCFACVQVCPEGVLGKR